MNRAAVNVLARCRGGYQYHTIYHVYRSDRAYSARPGNIASVFFHNSDRSQRSANSVAHASISLPNTRSVWSDSSRNILRLKPLITNFAKMSSGSDPVDLFTDIGTAVDGVVALTTGAPGGDRLANVASLLEKATQHTLVKHITSSLRL